MPLSLPEVMVSIALFCSTCKGRDFLIPQSLPHMQWVSSGVPMQQLLYPLSCWVRHFFLICNRRDRAWRIFTGCLHCPNSSCYGVSQVSLSYRCGWFFPCRLKFLFLRDNREMSLDIFLVTTFIHLPSLILAPPVLSGYTFLYPPMYTRAFFP